MLREGQERCLLQNVGSIRFWHFPGLWPMLVYGAAPATEAKQQLQSLSQAEVAVRATLYLIWDRLMSGHVIENSCAQVQGVGCDDVGVGHCSSAGS